MNIIDESWIDLETAAPQRLLLKDLEERSLKADVLRLDRIHPVVSGNKWFKLGYYLQEAIDKHYESILTFGGAWSNHIIATAYAANQLSLASIGIIRGERPAKFSATLQAAQDFGMHLEFVSRESYNAKDTLPFREQLTESFGRVYIIPEGGAGEQGILGSTRILKLASIEEFTHIVCCIGTGTMYAGIAISSLLAQEVLGIVVLKGLEKGETKLVAPIYPEKLPNCKINYDYHFSGYAKKTPALIQFMNSFYQDTGIPTDFVYTGKLFYAFVDLLKKGYFRAGSNILIVHSGGLQGNASLVNNELLF